MCRYADCRYYGRPVVLAHKTDFFYLAESVAETKLIDGMKHCCKVTKEWIRHAQVLVKKFLFVIYFLLLQIMLRSSRPW